MKKHRNRPMQRSRRKVALEALRQQHRLPELARRYGVHTSQSYEWKAQLLDRAARVLEAKGEAASSRGSSEREQELLKKIVALECVRVRHVRGATASIARASASLKASRSSALCKHELGLRVARRTKQIARNYSVEAHHQSWSVAFVR